MESWPREMLKPDRPDAATAVRIGPGSVEQEIVTTGLLETDTAKSPTDPTRRWTNVSLSRAPVLADPPLRPTRIYIQIIAMTVLVVVAVALFGAIASRQMAEHQAVGDAAHLGDMLATTVVQPALRNGIVDQEPHAVARLDAAVRSHLVGDSIIRVKLWTADGLVVYSNDPVLVGKSFPLSDDHKAVIAHPALRAEVTDLQEPENAYERGNGKLLEVYRPVYTPDGQALVMEIYSPYSTVIARASELWRGFASITIASLLVLSLLLLPVVWRLLQRLNRSKDQREVLLKRAVDASAEERRRIAATLHDGVVQELVAASFVVSAAAARAEADGRDGIADGVRQAANTVRTSIGGLRTLLVDIYPPTLDATGLESALGDLVASLRARHIDVRLSGLGRSTGLSKDSERLVFQVAQECLRNVARHSGATAVEIKLAAEGNEMVLDVIDNGIGFDPEEQLRSPKAGHFGLRLMADATTYANGQLRVSSALGAGTHWQLRVPTTSTPGI
jgi:two-component system NarL family sensor kinase